MTKAFFIYSLFSFQILLSQTTGILNQESLDNYANTYNYTYWKDNWKNNNPANQSFVIQASSFAAEIGYADLSLKNLQINDDTSSQETAFNTLNSDLFSSFSNNLIDYSLTNGIITYGRPANPTNNGLMDAQMGEYGTWRNTRFVSTNFTNNPSVDNYFTGIDFRNSHDELTISFKVRPTAAMPNTKLNLTVNIPNQYTQLTNTSGFAAYTNASNQGFYIVPNAGAGGTVTANSSSITLSSANMNLVAGTSYTIELTLRFVTSNLSNSITSDAQQRTQTSISANQLLPTPSPLTSAIQYLPTENLHLIDIPRYVMGQYDCTTAGDIQTIQFDFSNTEAFPKRVKLCIRQLPNINVTGFSSILCNLNGDPTGLPIQVSKNWHTGTAQEHSGSWIKEYVEIIVPANTTLQLLYKRTGAKWGETYGASSHQLCVAGAGVPRGGWLEAALGSFGENITHSPDIEYGNTNGADIRPFLVTNENYGGTSTECSWTGNVGGCNMWVYDDTNGLKQYQTEVKTDFKRYSPNLTETTIGAVSNDKKLKWNYTFFLNRSDDYTRIYYKVNIEALENVSYDRFDIFQLGGDHYNIHNAQSLIFGNDTGIVNQFNPTNSGSNDYTTAAIPLPGKNPWIWAGNGLAYNGASTGIDIDCNNGLIIRDYQAVFAGDTSVLPYFRERSSSTGFSASHGTNPTSYCLVPPPSVTSFQAGDKIELVAEVVILPKTPGDYYGPNQLFDSLLNLYGNSYELLFREAKENALQATSEWNVIDSVYPLSIATVGDSAIFHLKGGVGYVPIRFTNVTDVTNPELWKLDQDCWELVDQSVHGKDFWQVNYNKNSATYDLIYNVNKDLSEEREVTYYLGNTPPQQTLLSLYQLGQNPVQVGNEVHAIANQDTVTLTPNILWLGQEEMYHDTNYFWSGPNGFSANQRVVFFEPFTAVNEGVYQVVFDGPNGCRDTMEYEVILDGYAQVSTLQADDFLIFPNPNKGIFSVNQTSFHTRVFALNGTLIFENKKPSKSFQLEHLPKGYYLIEMKNYAGVVTRIPLLIE